jgi:hypothetical protein
MNLSGTNLKSGTFSALLGTVFPQFGPEEYGGRSPVEYPRINQKTNELLIL